MGDFMAIQTINLTVPGGDTPRSANTKINANFTDQTHAASKLVGPRTGNIPLAQDVHKSSRMYTTLDYTLDGGLDIDLQPVGDVWTRVRGIPMPSEQSMWTVEHTRAHHVSSNFSTQLAYGYMTTNFAMRSAKGSSGGWTEWAVFYNDRNTTIEEGTGFLRVSSPVLHVYNDKIDKIHEAEQLDITVDKKGVGHYEIHGTTGLRQNDGWNMSPPRDIHGNVRCMIEVTEKDGVITVKTYKRKFDLELAAIVHDYDNPLDIPEGACVELRFNDLPQEPLTDLDKTNL